LIASAELLIRGATGLAAAAGIAPMIIGLTVVAFGTSAPELAISLSSAAAGADELVLGNVVGSNILNVLLVLGLAASIRALVVDAELVHREVPVMIGASVLVLIMARDGTIARGDGLVLAALLVLYLALTVGRVRRPRSESAAVQAEYASEYGSGLRRAGPRRAAPMAGMVIAGIAGLVLGARWLLNGSVAVATDMGVSELVIGLTVVAFGTSAPELAASAVASARGKADIAAGNVVGSNLFNLLSVLGLSAIVAPGGLAVPPASVTFDIPFMVAVAVACLPLFLSGYRISRWEGFFFLAYFAAYMVYLLLGAAEHDSLPQYSRVLFEFVVPITGVTLGVVGVRAWRARRVTT
jgi:cation:H+ antiporter